MKLLPVFLLAVSLIGCNENAGKNQQTAVYKSGTYTGIGQGKNGDIKLKIKFSKERIESISVIESNETKGICEPAFEKIPAAVIQDQTLNIDTVTGATMSSHGLLEAVADAVTKAGGNAEELQNKQRVAKEQTTVEIETDVVVVGAGASGSSAAVAASEKGAKVVLLEKAAGVSGAGSMAGVLFADHSRLQKAENKEVSSEWIYDQYITDSNYYANSRLVSAIINKSASTIEWLMQKGVHLALLDAGYGSQYNHVGMPATAHGYVDGGVTALKTLHEKVIADGGQVFYETAGESLIIENDQVAGVVAYQSDGTKLNIHAGSVILSTGGFGGNAEMMKDTFGDKVGTGLVKTATGDGLNMAWSAGAGRSSDIIAQWFGMTYDSVKSKNMKYRRDLTKFVRNPLLFVNNRGIRFGSEEEAYESAALGTMIYNQPDAEMFIIFDQTMIERVAEKGLADVFVDRWGHMYGHGIKYAEAGHVADIDKMTDAWRAPKDYTEVIDDAVNAGIVVQADTIEQLAEKLNAPCLTEEVQHYNAMAHSGKDTEFYKDSKFMYPIEKGPYYGVITKLRCLGTLGGVTINENIQALDDSGNPVKNLWVTGADAGGMYGNSYVMFEGATLGFAYNSGRIAGENAAANALK